MASWTSWIIGISVAVVAIAFVVLVIFLIRVLLELKVSLKNTNAIVVDVEKKLHSFDPLFNAVNSISSAVERQAACVKHCADELSQEAMSHREHKVEKTTHRVLEVVEWALVGVALLQKLRKK